MTRTKDKQRTIEGVERELEEVRTRLAEMQTELARVSAVPEISWDGVSEETAQELVEAEKKRLTLPHLITAAEVKAKELELELVRLRVPEAESQTAKAYAVRGEKKAKLDEAQEEHDVADGEWNGLLRLNKDLKATEHRLTKELADKG
jgi:hypothetical protein